VFPCMTLTPPYTPFTRQAGPQCRRLLRAFLELWWRARWTVRALLN